MWASPRSPGPGSSRDSPWQRHPRLADAPVRTRNCEQQRPVGCALMGPGSPWSVSHWCLYEEVCTRALEPGVRVHIRGQGAGKWERAAGRAEQGPGQCARSPILGSPAPVSEKRALGSQRPRQLCLSRALWAWAASRSRGGQCGMQVAPAEAATLGLPWPCLRGAHSSPAGPPCPPPRGLTPVTVAFRCSHVLGCGLPGVTHSFLPIV